MGSLTSRWFQNDREAEETDRHSDSEAGFGLLLFGNRSRYVA
jgi:hypothetical protein